MMQVTYLNYFTKLLKVPQYPLKGFVAKLSTLQDDGLDIDSINKSDFDKTSFRGGTSDPIVCNTFLNDSEFTIILDSSTQIDASGKYNIMYLYYIDLFQYPNASVTTFNKGSLTNEQLYDRLAMILNWDSNLDEFRLLFSFNEIIHIELPKDISIKCSFTKMNNSKNEDIAHYNSNLTGSMNYYEIKSDKVNVETNSGLTKVKEKISSLLGSDLKGRMTFTQSGIIQL